MRTVSLTSLHGAAAAIAVAAAPQPYAWIHSLSRAFAVSETLLSGCRPAPAATSWQRRGLLTSILSRKQADVPPQYPEQPDKYKLGNLEISDKFRWLADYEAARPFLQQEKRYFEAASKRYATAAGHLLQSMRHHVAATQYDDPPEQVGLYRYFNVNNPCGHDTIIQQHISTGKQAMLLSADIMQQDADKLTKRLGVRVSGDHLGGLKVSRDHRLLAYSLEMEGGSEQYCCVARDIQSGALLSSCVLPNVSSFEWSADGSCLYYCTTDVDGRPSKVHRRLLGRPTDDMLLFTEADPKHFATLTRTKDWHYILINTHSKLSSEVHLLDAHDNQSMPLCVHPRTPGMEYFVEHQRGQLLILTNRSTVSSTSAQQHATGSVLADASGRSSLSTAGSTPGATTAGDASTPGVTTAGDASTPGVMTAGDASTPAATGRNCSDYCLMSVAAAAAGSANASAWQLLLPAQQHTAITDMDVFDSCVVLHELQNARPGLRVVQLGPVQASAGQSGQATQQQLQLLHEQQVCVPEWALSLRPGINQDYNSSSMRLYVSSPAVPEVPMELNLATGQLQQFEAVAPEQTDMQMGTDQKGMRGDKCSRSEWWPHGRQQQQQLPLTCKRLWAASHDGTQVPITLVHARDMQYTGRAPVLVEVYGAYGQVLEADYRPHRLALIERGWAVALAHVRGGGEGGRRWHAAGRQLNKPNSVADLLACLQLLIQLQVSSPGRIAGAAASAGGLTLAAAVNAAPQLFSAIVLEAPFVDWCGEMGDSAPKHLLTEHEKDEWGDPSQQLVAQMISAMCPYSNLQEGDQYPALLVTAGLQDTRVPFWVPVKFVAKLRSLQNSGASLQKSGDQHHQQQSRPLLLQFAEDAGHFSIGHSAGSLEDIAFQYVFLDANSSR